jgi:hypothetical protein
VHKKLARKEPISQQSKISAKKRATAGNDSGFRPLPQTPHLPASNVDSFAGFALPAVARQGLQCLSRSGFKSFAACNLFFLFHVKHFCKNRFLAGSTIEISVQMPNC